MGNASDIPSAWTIMLPVKIREEAISGILRGRQSGVTLLQNPRRPEWVATCDNPPLRSLGRLTTFAPTQAEADARHADQH